MSIRQYRPRSNRRQGITANQSLGLYLLLALAIALQISYPLVSGDRLRYITIFTVITGAVLMLAHSLLSYGFRYFATFASVTFIFALVVEIIGSKTGWPFGSYVYGDSLGLKIAGVPVIVPFAWIMMAHPVLTAARRIAGNWVFLYGGVALAAWDLFLDPLMVAQGNWTWVVTGAHVPFQPEIPLSNTFGWLLSGMFLIGVLHVITPREKRKGGATFRTTDIFLLWTLFSGIIGNLFFFSRQGVAFFAGGIFGIVLAPYFFNRWLGRP